MLVIRLIRENSIIVEVPLIVCMEELYCPLDSIPFEQNAGSRTRHFAKSASR
jgi:hypothetical protein